LKQLSTLTEFAAIQNISETHQNNRETQHINTAHKHNTTNKQTNIQTHTDDRWENAAVAACRLNLNTRCMHKARISVHRSDNLYVMLKYFPQTHQASSMLVPCISFPFQFTTYPPIQHNATLTDRSSYPNTSSQQQCLEACWTQPFSPKPDVNYKAVLRDNLNRCCTIFHTLLDTKRSGKPHFYWPLFYASTASTN
jgi:hypothetical protein